jgi:hypothetical protein
VKIKTARGLRKEAVHKERLLKKVQRIEGLESLLQMWDERGEPDDDYVRGLRARLRKAQNELRCMRP